MTARLYLLFLYWSNSFQTLCYVQVLISYAIVSILKGHERAVNCVAWSPVEGSQMIASASDDNTIIISDVSTGAKVSVLKGHTAEVKCVMWSPN